MGNKKVFAGSIALITALSLSSCASTPSKPPYPTKTSSAVSSETPTSTPSETKPPTEAPTAWTRYTSADGRYVFEHPEAWSVADTPGDGMPDSTILTVTDTASGNTVANFSAGGARDVSYPVMVPTGVISFLTNTPVTVNRFDDGITAPDGQVNLSYATFTKEGVVQAGMGLTTDTSRAQTEATALVFIMKNQLVAPDVYFGQFATPVPVEGSTVKSIIPTFATLDEAKTFMDTQTYKDLERMFSSVTIVTD